jgi:hypothetical protein
MLDTFRPGLRDPSSRRRRAESFQSAQLRAAAVIAWPQVECTLAGQRPIPTTTPGQKRRRTWRWSRSRSARGIEAFFDKQTAAPLLPQKLPLPDRRVWPTGLSLDCDRARRGAERRGLLLRVRDGERGRGHAASRQESTRHRELHQGWHPRLTVSGKAPGGRCASRQRQELVNAAELPASNAK